MKDTIMQYQLHLLVVIILSLFSSIFAETIIIPLDDETIQGGIDMVEDGDTVFVMPEEYVENINFDGKAITVAAIPGLTTIDGNYEGPCVRFNSGEDALSILLGFTLINGNGVDGRGGRIYIGAITPALITNNTIVNNESGNEGGGVCSE